MVRKYFTLALVLLVALLPCASSIAASDEVATDAVTYYTYPITLESEDWSDYSVQEKVEMLRIPDETLTKMTDEALVTAIAEYPYLCDLYVYGTISDGIEATRSYFSALDELMSRDSCTVALEAFGLPIAEEYYNIASAETDQTCAAYYSNAFVSSTMCELLETLDPDVIIETEVDPETGYTSFEIVG